ncbi:hypothetical protein CTI12_AA057610 [Artemisia annua]|uniref:Uncharacterized protein n=1 Tax=Artemisia annua TaxID=35608 RepID=A0A2U1PT50_ARTAN|nr:hypothetical protein CTI12_AA057610 [Artemisia annua]
MTNTTHTLISSQNPNVDNCDEKPVRIIPGLAGIVQAKKRHKIADTRDCREECVMSTLEYIRKIVEDVGKDEDFMHGPRVSAVEFVNADEGKIVIPHG